MSCTHSTEQHSAVDIKNRAHNDPVKWFKTWHFRMKSHYECRQYCSVDDITQLNMYYLVPWPKFRCWFSWHLWQMSRKVERKKRERQECSSGIMAFWQAITNPRNAYSGQICHCHFESCSQWKMSCQLCLQYQQNMLLQQEVSGGRWKKKKKEII